MNVYKMLFISLLAALPLTSFAQTCHKDLKPTTPDSRFKILGDGSEVQDIKTNLIWQRCRIGQTWDSSSKTCNGSPQKMDWKTALQNSKKLGNGYRLPNIKELQSIVEYQCNEPSINQTIFAGHDDGSDLYFSSTPDQTDGAKVFNLNFHSKVTESVNKIDATNTARAVREAK